MLNAFGELPMSSDLKCAFSSKLEAIKRFGCGSMCFRLCLVGVEIWLSNGPIFSGKVGWKCLAEFQDRKPNLKDKAGFRSGQGYELQVQASWALCQGEDELTCRSGWCWQSAAGRRCSGRTRSPPARLAPPSLSRSLARLPFDLT